MRNLKILLTVSVIIMCCAGITFPILKDLPIPVPTSTRGDISEIYIYNFGILPWLPQGIGCVYVAWAPDDSSIFVADQAGKQNFIYDFRNREWSSLGSKEPPWIHKEAGRIIQTRDGYSLSPDGLYCARFLTEGPRELVISSTKDLENFIIPKDMQGRSFKKDIYNIYSFRAGIFGWKKNKPAWSHNGKYIAIVDEDLTCCVGIITLGGYQPQISQPAPKEETPSVKVCPQCGEKYPDSYNRCPKCGVRLKPKE